ncbi:DUF4142 domain-containing protein [Streptomyces sp. MP131-18]|uniref:DUF4142 domain-containing protein n=1 Tax=Streptomyces sp. MP131-18 TaxID=1857892 RepID=UPI00097BD291|nr:DUF4142 domain-containing protein [Streptomyces sp. MP131-18]ONK15079.1 putative outer membrane protein [Streptomyces sp. MP131-18]
MRAVRTAAITLAALCLAGSPAGLAHAQDNVSAEDETFVTSAHQSNLAEIAAGQDAGENATTQCVKNVGAALVRDHTRLDEALTELADQFGIPLPDAPTEEQQRQLAEVRAEAGTPAYDEKWLLTQAAAHEATLALIDRELDAGTNADVKAAAEAARPVVEMHLEMVRDGVCHD